mgnify:CR=1 FL=1
MSAVWMYITVTTFKGRFHKSRETLVFAGYTVFNNVVLTNEYMLKYNIIILNIF